jgi:hypothetical protein
MQTTYYNNLQHYISKGTVRLIRTKSLADGTTANWYTPATGYKGSEFIEIDSIVYVFSEFTEAAEWFVPLDKAPDPPRRTVKIDYDFLSKPVSLDYNLLTYDFFHKCRCKSLTVLGETILKDGRVSVLYADIPGLTYSSESYFRVEYYLVIGRLVFTHWNPEPLVLLESLINSEYLTTWRPELAGKLNYVPAYKLSVLNKHHGRFLKEMHIIKSFVTPTGLVADVYGKTDNPGHCRIITGNLIYLFKTVADCEIIIDDLIANDIRVQPELKTESIRKNLDVIGARLNRFINADLAWHKSKAIVSASGSITGLNAII